MQSYRRHLEGRDPIWGDDWSHSSFIRRSPSRRFPGVFLSHKANAKRSVHSPQDHFIIILIISDWCDTEVKWPLTRNLDRSWRHRWWLKAFRLQPMAPWTTDSDFGAREFWYLITWIWWIEFKYGINFFSRSSNFIFVKYMLHYFRL